MRPHGNTNEGPLVCRGRSYPTTPPNPAIRVGAINPKIFGQKILFPITALTSTALVVHLSLGKRNNQGPGAAYHRSPTRHLGYLLKNFFSLTSAVHPGDSGPAAPRFRPPGVLDPNSLAHHRYPAG